MSHEIYLKGLTTDQLSEIIRESVRDEMQNLKPPKQKSDNKFLTRKETAKRLKVSLVTLTDWVNRGRIKAHKIGGRVLFRESDVEEALSQIIPKKRPL